MKVGVSVVTMNRSETFLATLRAAVELSSDGDADLTVVDNGSDDPGTGALLASLERSGVTVIRNPTNLGLSRGVNQGLEASAKAGADVLVHLDDDALIATPDWDRALASYFSHPRVGIAFTNPAGPGVPKGGDGSGPRYREVSWGLGFCWALRREAYDAVGGYDPGLVHQNECDLALRVRLAGWEAAGVDGVRVEHNDSGGERSALSLAREHFGVVQFRDKWVKYFEGRDAGYGAMPLSLMPHWPPDQDLLRRVAEHHGVELNPEPGTLPTLGPGSVLGITPETVATIEDGQQLIEILGRTYLVYRALRNDYAHWERGDGYMRDRQRAIDRWRELTGESWEGYRWPAARLRPEGA